MLKLQQYTEILSNDHLDEWQRGYFERRRREAGGRRLGWVDLLGGAFAGAAGAELESFARPRMDFDWMMERERRKREHERGQG